MTVVKKYGVMIGHSLGKEIVSNNSAKSI